jgi:predicted DNA-binding transcriptional regulator AlpA
MSETELRRMLDISQVLAIVPVSSTTLFSHGARPNVPCKPRHQPKARAWYEDEILAWQRALPINSRISRRSRRKISET